MEAESLCVKYVEIRIKSSKACDDKECTTSQLLKTSVVEERRISPRLIMKFLLVQVTECGNLKLVQQAN